MTRRIHCLISIVCFLLVFPLSASAEEQKVKIEADSIEYSASDDVAVARGHVTLYYQGMIFKSEKLEYEASNWVVKTDQPFVILQDHQEMKGIGIQYNLRDNMAMGGNTMLIRGRGQLRSQSIIWKGDRYETTDAFFSSCSKTDKDYYITARQANYYPQRKKNNLELVDASLFLYGTRIITFPSLTLTVGEKKKLRKRILPAVEYSSQRGSSLSYDYGYWSDDHNDGIISVEYYSQIGFGGRISHYYDINENESVEGMIRYLSDTGMQGGAGYRHVYGEDELQILAMRRDIVNSGSFTNYYTYYLITQLPEIQWTNAGRPIGDSGFSMGYQLSYGDYSENLITSAGPSLSQVKRSRWRGSLNLGYRPISLSPSTRLSPSIGETYSSYSGGEFQSSAFGQLSFNQTLWGSAWMEAGYRHLIQDGLSPFNFDQRDISNNFFIGSLDSPLWGDLWAGVSYVKDLDRNADSILDYRLRYLTDCLQFTFTYGVISKGWSIEFKLLDVND